MVITEKLACKQFKRNKKPSIDHKIVRYKVVYDFSGSKNRATNFSLSLNCSNCDKINE